MDKKHITPEKLQELKTKKAEKVNTQQLICKENDNRQK